MWQVETTGPVHTDLAFRRVAGVMTTAGGLVFHGDIGGNLHILDAKTGRQLHDLRLGTSVLAAPMTYSVRGEQYVALMAGGNFKDSAFVDHQHNDEGRIIALKLGGGTIPQRIQQDAASETLSPPSMADAAPIPQREAGEKLFEQLSTVCHAHGGRAPEPAWMSAAAHRDFTSIVLGGIRAEKGMPNFRAALTDADAQAIQGYLVHLVWKQYRCARTQ